MKSNFDKCIVSTNDNFKIQKGNFSIEGNSSEKFFGVDSYVNHLYSKASKK